MASDSNSVKIPAASPVRGSQARIPVSVHERGGKVLPRGGNLAPTPAAQAAPTPAAQAATKAGNAAATAALVALLNKHLNDSGRPNEYRVDPNSDNKLIQQINPASGEVVGEFLIAEFPALARSVGVSGALIDSHA